MNPGDLLHNRYRIEKALAAGGFGETYLAVDLDYPGQRQVVVKQLKPARSDPKSLEIARRLFESEAKVLAREAIDSACGSLSTATTGKSYSGGTNSTISTTSRSACGTYSKGSRVTCAASGTNHQDQKSGNEHQQ
jgi:serine/threonine protein kinase